MVNVSDETTTETVTRDDVVIGPKFTKKVRTTIDPDEWHRASKEATQVALDIRALERTIAPTKAKLKALKARQESLLDDAENQTEETERTVYEEKHFNTSEILVRDAETEAVLERRTMTAEDHQLDAFDRKKKEPEAAPPADKKPKGSRKAKNPAFQAAVDASDAQGSTPPASEGDAEHLTPGEAIARAREEGDQLHHQ